jgi:hypothetical protein
MKHPEGNTMILFASFSFIFIICAVLGMYGVVYCKKKSEEDDAFKKS